MKTKYTVVETLCHQGTMVPIGTELMLSDTAAKYLGHALVKTADLPTESPLPENSGTGPTAPESDEPAAPEAVVAIVKKVARRKKDAAE